MEWLAVFLTLAAVVGFMILAFKLGQQSGRVTVADELVSAGIEKVKLEKQLESLASELRTALDDKEQAKRDWMLATNQLNIVKSQLDAKHDKLNVKQVEIEKLKMSYDELLGFHDQLALEKQELAERLRERDGQISDYRNAIREHAKRLSASVDNESFFTTNVEA